jgi:flagellar motor switch protein FliG
MPPLPGRPATIGGPLTGVQKCAVLCMALGPDVSAKVLQQLTPAEMEAVSREIASTPVVRAEVVDSVLNEFNGVAQAVESVARGGVEFAKQVLEQAFGPNRARAVLERIQEQMTESGMTRLKKAAPEVLNNVLRGEHPQTIALILAHLDSKQAAGVVEAMEPPLASDVLYRVARMEKVSPEMLELVELGLGNRSDFSLTQEMRLSGGPDAVAKVLNFLGGSQEKSLLEAIAGRSAELAEAIRNLMFVFEDLRRLDGRSMQRLLREIDNKELALSLKAASDELKKHILSNMSERAGSALQDELDAMGPVLVKDVEAAHAKILSTARSLADAGEIVITSPGADEEVIQ